MSPVFHVSPWSHFCDLPGLSLEEANGQTRETVVFPRIVGKLPPDFAWNGHVAVLASHGGEQHPDHWDVALPNGATTQHFSSNMLDGCMHLHGLPARTPDEEGRESDPRELWLHWQYQSYKELSHYEPGGPSPLECGLAFGARRTWETVREHWKRGDEDTAELALIVELARSKKLVRALQAIGQNPRRMLRRVHARQKLARIQEMDHLALRVLSRTPGRTPAEKAGPRQELLAVVKEDTSDLPENAVLMWCVRRMDQMARAYGKRNERWKAHERCVAVARLRSVLGSITKHPNLQDVGALHHHLMTPTYCLQFERRYRHIWRAYVKIRRQDQAIDDVWRWQGHLWGSTARLLLGALFLDTAEWREIRLSTPYFLSEGAFGEWTTGPSVPGPLESPIGTCHVVDLREENSPQQIQLLDLPEEVLLSGADWILCWPERKALCLLWAVLSGTEGSIPPDFGLLREKLIALGSTTGWTWTGLVLHSLPEATSEEVEWIVQIRPVFVLQLPGSLHSHWEDLGTSLNRALDELDVH